MSSIQFKSIAYGSESWKAAVSLREVILREPLGQSFSEAELLEEAQHLHLIALMNEKIIATVVLVPEGSKFKMQRVVVDSHLRNQSIGSQLMSFCEDFSLQHGIHYLYCHARDSAVSFYLQNNYVIEGEYFLEDGIPHVKMFKNI